MTTSNETESKKPSLVMDTEDRWEWWAIVALVLALCMVVSFGVGLARLGIASITALVVVLPLLSMASMPVLFFGLLRTVLRPPAIRRTRSIAFVSLFGAVLVGNLAISVPLTTEDWKSDQEYRLPFAGAWSVTAGGDDVERNYHAMTAAYRWGFDFSLLKDGKDRSGDGNTNEDYHCWSQPVLSPVAGRVITVLNDQPDNEPGIASTSGSPLGNHIIIEVAADEFVFLAHLQKGSVSVAQNDTVTIGQPLAKCGNSGHSLLPQIHLHGQNSPRFPLAEGLPIRFSRIQLNGVPQDQAMPKGQSEWEKWDGDLVENL